MIHENGPFTATTPEATIPETTAGPTDNSLASQTYQQKEDALGTHPVITVSNEKGQPKENDIQTSMKTSFMFTLHQMAKLEFPFGKYLRDETQKNPLPFLRRAPPGILIPQFTEDEKARYYHPVIF